VSGSSSTMSYVPAGASSAATTADAASSASIMGV